LSSVVDDSRVVPAILPRLRLVRGILLWYATFVLSLILIWYQALPFPYDFTVFPLLIFYTMFFSFLIVTFELYYGAKFLRKPSTNILSGEPIAVLVLSLYVEILVMMMLLISPFNLHSSIPLLFFALALVHFAIYISLFLLEVSILYSKYSSRPQKVPEIINSYTPERYR
jgi:hypothetical protein